MLFLFSITLNQTTKIFIVLLSCLLLNGCMGMAVSGANAAYNHRSLQKKVSDYYITLRIKDALTADKEIDRNARINVTTYNQLVLLTGQAPTVAMQQRAVEITRRTDGVIRVFNSITISQPISSSIELQDTWITTKIKSRFIASNDIEPSKIKVVTENHVVYLLGIVPKPEADAAVEIAKYTDGVLRVVTIFYYVQMPNLE